MRCALYYIAYKKIIQKLILFEKGYIQNYVALFLLTLILHNLVQVELMLVKTRLIAKNIHMYNQNFLYCISNVSYL